MKKAVYKAIRDPARAVNNDAFATCAPVLSGNGFVELSLDEAKRRKETTERIRVTFEKK